MLPVRQSLILGKYSFSQSCLYCTCHSPLWMRSFRYFIKVIINNIWEVHHLWQVYKWSIKHFTAWYRRHLQQTCSKSRRDIFFLLNPKSSFIYIHVVSHTGTIYSVILFVDISVLQLSKVHVVMSPYPRALFGRIEPLPHYASMR